MPGLWQQNTGQDTWWYGAWKLPAILSQV